MGKIKAFLLLCGSAFLVMMILANNKKTEKIDLTAEKFLQTVAGKKEASDGKVYYSYMDIHKSLAKLAPRIKEFKPDVILAIGGGGYVPARILRPFLKVPILAISLELYDDATNTVRDKVKKIQWFDETSEVARNMDKKRVLIVDEVDDSRTTLSYCVEEVRKTNNPAAIAVAVVHNKVKKKSASIPEDVTYFAAENVPDKWNCYPWEAGENIVAHEALAAECDEFLGE